MHIRSLLSVFCTNIDDTVKHRVYYNNFKEESVGNVSKAKVGVLESKCLYCNRYMDIEVKYFQKDDILNTCSCSHENWGYHPEDLKILHENNFIKESIDE
jgi:hypothetical protein